MSTPERFIDGIGNLAVQGAVARVELTVIEKLPAQNEAPTYEVAERLVMSVDTMLRLYHGLGEVVGQMEVETLQTQTIQEVHLHNHLVGAIAEAVAQVLLVVAVAVDQVALVLAAEVAVGQDN